MSWMTIHSGLERIGGNIVEIATERVRVLTDFGVGIGDSDASDEHQMSDLEQHLLAGSLPRIEGIFETDQFQRVTLADRQTDQRPLVVILSHLHIDHMGGLIYLPSDATVYMSESTWRLYQQLIQLGLEQLPACQMVPVNEDEWIDVEDISFCLKKSDHDVPGVASIWLETPDAKLIHSGDFRLHGTSPEDVLDWARAAHEWQPDILLIEGTTYSKGTDEGKVDNQEESNKARLYLASEAALVAEFKQLLKQQDQLIAINLYERNIERIVALHRAAQQLDKTFVMETAIAQLVRAFYPDEKIVEWSPAVRDEILTQPSKFILQNSYAHIDRLAEIGAGLYLHSNGTPLGDYDPEYAQMLSQVEAAGFEFQRFAVSGHATPEDILTIAKTVDATWTIPWHTFNPERLEQALEAIGLQPFMPSCQHSYDLAKGLCE